MTIQEWKNDFKDFINELNLPRDDYREIMMYIDGVPEQEWIPCSERLPEDDAEVFVYLFDCQSPYIAWVTDSCWFTEEFQVEKENYPKAWMPLPEPYKERQEEHD